MQIVFLDAYTMNHGDLDVSKLEALGKLQIYDRTLPAEILDRAADADIVITNKVLFDKSLIGKLPKLKYICVAATGYNNVDIEAANEKGVLVSNVVGYSTQSVAQHVFALIFSLINKTAEYGNEVSQGKWSSCKDFSYWNAPIVEMYEKTLGIYGFGKIGQAVGKIGLGLGMNVIACHKHPERDKTEGVTFVEWETLLEKSDFLSLHAPLTNQNQGIFNAETFSKMKDSAILINTSRGPVVNEADLAQALNQNKLSGAGLDVMVNEPPSVNNPLLSAKNCMITPHHAWATREARQRLLDGLVENISSFKNGEPINTVN